MMRSLLIKAVRYNSLRSLDLQAGLTAERWSGGSSPDLLLAAALASRAVGEGHICLPLAEVASGPVFGPELPCTIPEIGEWRKTLLASGVVGLPGEPKPLILDKGDRLYLTRYYAYETLISNDLLRRSLSAPAVDMERAAQLIGRLFDDNGHDDGQKMAAAAAVLQQFLVISGGPGTGKTYTVARILALLQTLAGGSLRIGLAAPTGRAAVRLHESIAQARQTLDDDLAGAVPDVAQTLHRLLGLNPHSGRCRYHKENQLHLDLLVIDEASMIDVPLMAGLLDALPESTGLILLGDRDQLTSVEAGSLFGDLCGKQQEMWSVPFCRRIRDLTGTEVLPAGEHQSFGDSLSLLRTSYRFAEKSGIGELAGIVKEGDRAGLTGILQKKYKDFVCIQPGNNDFGKWLEEEIWQGVKDCFQASGPEEALAALSRFRVLCAVRAGRTGVAGINQLAESMLSRRGLIGGGEPWYRGRPVMIRRNQYSLQLFNGDIGITWPDKEGQMWAWFRRPDGALCPVAFSRLPEHETAYATTIHKAQGSEFDEVLLILPLEDNRILSRELIYTGITRARQKLTLYGDSVLLAESISRRVVRYSGLSDSLWHGNILEQNDGK